MSGNMDLLITNIENLKHLPHQLNNMQKQLACMTEEMQGIKLAIRPVTSLGPQEGRKVF